MKKIYCYFLISLCMIFFYSCKDDEIAELSAGSIYGKITDYGTGEPVSNANVTLLPGGETTLTGYDGMYEFLNVKEGNYTLAVSKAEYNDLLDDYQVCIENRNRSRRDLQIKRNASELRITDIYGNDISYLDFGNEPSVTIRSFNIFNGGTVGINCSITYSCNWIKSVSSIPNTIAPGQNVTIDVEIDRALLPAGNNTNNLYINSNNGSNFLEIRATAQSILPNVLTLPVTNTNGEITPWNNTFNATVTNIGNPAYHHRGFCFSSTNTTPTINDNRIDVSGTGIGNYSYTYWDFPPYTVTYYVRAWVMYDSDNKIQYGNVQSFTFNNVQ